PAEVAGMEVPLRTLRREFQPEVPAHAHEEHRLVVREHRAVGVAAEVGREPRAVRLDEFRERPASGLLVALEDRLHADRELAVELAPERDRVEHREVLALVVPRAAAPDAVAVDDGLEGLRAPAFLLLVGRIDVVMAVEEPRRSRIRRADLRVDDGMARGRMHLDRESPAFEAAAKEGDLVLDAFSREAHGGDAHRFEKGFDEGARALPDGIRDGGVHLVSGVAFGACYAKNAAARFSFSKPCGRSVGSPRSSCARIEANNFHHKEGSMIRSWKMGCALAAGLVAAGCGSDLSPGSP